MKKFEMKELFKNSISSRPILEIRMKYDAYERYCFPLKAGDKLFMYAKEDDFILDGFSIRRFRDLKKIGTVKNACRRIVEKEGVLEGLSFPDIDLTDWRSVFLSLQAYGKNIIIEHAGKDDEDWDFWIGRIVKVLKNKVVFKHFDADGVWVEEPYDIPYASITNVNFDCRYVTVFSKYV
ncbi:MAG: hypothetical protein II149_04515 [Clostridia bacterium]|nr:hypothetical protein [Clostridia bacterium]